MIGRSFREFVTAGAAVACLACQPEPPPPAPTPAPVPPASIGSASHPPAPPGIDRATFGRLFTELSEPDRGFFSTNYVSNETSYLQVAPDLVRLGQPGGAYLGVGPEQNFAYLALLRPTIAFIVDIRRQNAMLHLLYKACFEMARSRSEFVTLLLGRPYQPAGDPGPEADVTRVLDHAERLPPDAANFAALHAALLRHLEVEDAVPLSAADRDTLRRTHQAFFQGQLGTRFELEQSGRRYPSLREILSAAGPDGEPAGYLASESAFRCVQDLQRRHRVIPVVGDFAGSHALRAVAAEIRRQGLTVSAFYVSNVEQYVIDPEPFRRYFANVSALPIGPGSLFIRAYLDQGRRHPRQLAGHRTATSLHTVQDFVDRYRSVRHPSFYQVATEGLR
jgi:hypothetical protein